MNTESTEPVTLEEYLGMEYPFRVIADPDGGYFVEVPDLPGCMTQAETRDEIIPMIEDARHAWLETAFELGREIPPPSYPEEYSGKFNLRIPKSLHRKVAGAAVRDGVSLNSYVASVLARGDAQAQVEQRLQNVEVRLEQRLADLEEHLQVIRASVQHCSVEVPMPTRKG